MTREQIIERMVLASKEDRERFFKVADGLSFQKKYQQYSSEIEELKQEWRDMATLPNYPNINFPLSLPEWFPNPYFASNWKKDIYIEECLKK